MSTPTLPTLDLSESELEQIQSMAMQVMERRFYLEVHDAYYRGEARIADLGISIPPQLRQLHTALGWPRVAVDAIEERLRVDGFRYPGATDADTDLWDIWRTNKLDEEGSLAFLDALVFGRAYAAVGSSDSTDVPLVTVESPLDMTVDFDARTREIRSALRLYQPVYYGEYQGAEKAATLYLPDETIHAVQGVNGNWQLTERDRHRLGQVPVSRMVNRQRTADREGNSEITPEIMSVTDAACRTMLGLEVAREFYSAPKMYILGATESAFQAADGSAKSAWDTYLGRVLALERDEEGNVPTIGQLTAYDPSVYTKVIDMYARQMSSLTGMPPHYLGYTTDNPASADAIRSTEARLVKKVERRQQAFAGALEDAMRLALLIRDGSIPPEARRITTIWHDAGTPTIAETTDAITKMVQIGSVPATSDITLSRLGFTPTEIEQLQQDRALDMGASVLAELASSLTAKEARVDKAIATTISPQAAKSAPTVNPATGQATVPAPTTGNAPPTPPTGK